MAHAPETEPSLADTDDLDSLAAVTPEASVGDEPLQDVSIDLLALAALSASGRGKTTPIPPAHAEEPEAADTRPARRGAWRATALGLAAGFLLGVPSGGYLFAVAGWPSARPPDAQAVTPPAATAPTQLATTAPAAPQLAVPQLSAPQPAPGRPASLPPPSSAPGEAAVLGSRAPTPRSPALDEAPPAVQPPSVAEMPAVGPEPQAAPLPASPRPAPGNNKPVVARESAPDTAQAATAAPRAAQAQPSQGPIRQANALDSMLDEALASPQQRAAESRRAAALAEAAAIPAAPSREDVTQAMVVLLPAIRACAAGKSGLATAGIVVNQDGRVVSVSVSGAPFEGTASARCMEGVVRRARFPRFTQPVFRVHFPFAIQ